MAHEGRGDKENIERIGKLRDLSWEPRVPLYDNSNSATRGTPGKRTTVGAGRRICRDAEDMLIKAWRKPLPMTDLYKELSLSGYMGNKLKKILLRENFVDEMELATNRRGRRKKLLQVLPKGRDYLERLGIMGGPKGRGGVRHRYYQEKLKEWYERHGYTVEIEARIGDTSLDVLAIRQDRQIGIEIALSVQGELLNARKAAEAGLEYLIFVCETKEIMEKLRRKVGALLKNWPKTRFGFRLVIEYLEE